MKSFIIALFTLIWLAWWLPITTHSIFAQQCGSMTKVFIDECEEDDNFNCVPKDVEGDGIRTYTESCDYNVQLGGCYALMQNAICGYDANGECDKLTQGDEYKWFACGSGGSSGGSTCGSDGFGQCGGTCPAGSYCRANLTNAQEAVRLQRAASFYD